MSEQGIVLIKTSSYP